jgi:hypothetical protein
MIFAVFASVQACEIKGFLGVPEEFFAAIEIFFLYLR